MRDINSTMVVCWWWGKWPESAPDMGEEYVRRLHRSLTRNTTVQFDFACFVDPAKYVNDSLLTDIEVHPIPDRWRDMTWNLKKLFMFDAFWAYDWVVALDLDLVITGQVDFLLTHRADGLVTCRAAYSDDIGGSIVAFDPRQGWTYELAQHVQQEYRELESHTRGSERKLYRLALKRGWLPKVEYWQDEYPHSILSYKVDGGPKNGARVVRFHGRPRPHEVNHPWLEDNWR